MGGKAIVLAAALAGLIQAEVELGARAPDVELRSLPGQSLQSFQGKKVVVVFAEETPGGMSKAAEELGELGVEMLHASPLAEGPGVWLVDEEGIVRLAEPPLKSGRAIVDLVKEWELGKASFESSCPVCHDESGQEVYPGVKPLHGIGNRLSREHIRSKLNATMISPGRYSIRCFQFTEREMKALVLYVAGL